MTKTIELGDIVADVIRKNIKNVHLRVYPPTGRVRISAPFHVNLDTIRAFAISKLGWIKQQQEKLRDQERETPREYLDRETHHVWGKRYMLEVLQRDAAARVEVNDSTLALQVRPGTDVARKQAILDQWYRDQIKEVIPALIEKWETVMDVKVSKFFVQKMKTKWGSCNPSASNIRLNSELAKKPPECLEYVLVHEMVHLLEPTHGRQFIALMDQFMPLWQTHRDALTGKQ